MDVDLFFPVSPAADLDPQVSAACARCPVQADCLDYAISRPEKHGVFGGLNEEDRAAVRRRRMRADLRRRDRAGEAA
jgi:hypothetical protein